MRPHTCYTSKAAKHVSNSKRMEHSKFQHSTNKKIPASARCSLCKEAWFSVIASLLLIAVSAGSASNSVPGSSTLTAGSQQQYQLFPGVRPKIERSELCTVSWPPNALRTPPCLYATASWSGQTPLRS